MDACVYRFGAGFSFTVVYAALLTKTNRISRIFNAGKRTAKRPSFITPKSQLIICSGLVSLQVQPDPTLLKVTLSKSCKGMINKVVCVLQVLVNVVWMVVSPPRAIHHYPRREDNLLICSSYVDASYMIAFGYPILLILVCTVYAVLTRNIPEAFNESKHIVLFLRNLSIPIVFLAQAQQNASNNAGTGSLSSEIKVYDRFDLRKQR
ncbi:hypothetical protein J6590_053313 [Homalodisca vitripennis]|nr:hypothetical protein J6590_053313 [Homalodisca vitripennis]